MAVPLHSLTPLLLLAFLAAVSVAHAARPTGADSDSLGKACNSTDMFAETCVRVLGTIPEASTASPHRLAVLAFQYLVKEGAALSTECESAIKAPKQPRNAPCLQSADGNLKSYLEFLAKLAPEQSDAKFAEARDKLSDQFVRFPFGTTCSVDEPVIGKVLEYEQMLQVTAYLLRNAAPAPAGQFHGR